MINEDNGPKVVRLWHELYVQFQSDPCDLRTDKKFCEDIGLEPATLSQWKRKYRSFIFREVEAQRKTYRNELRAIGLKALMRKLDSGDTNAIKLHFQLLGDLVEKTEIKTENMSDAEKVRRIESLRTEVTKRQEDWKKAADKDSTSV